MLTISETTKKKLSGSLRQIMPDLNVYANCFLTNSAPLRRLDESIKFDNETQKSIYSFIAEEPLHIYTRDWISRELYEREYDESITEELAVPLDKLDGITSIESLSAEIVRDFCSLPYNYKIFFPLHSNLLNILNDDEIEYEFGGGIRILRWSDDLASDFNRVSFESSSESDETPPDDDQADGTSGPPLVLELSMAGFFDRWNRSISAEIAVEKIKSFFGLCYATGLCEAQFGLAALPADSLIIYRTDGESPTANDRPLSLDDSLKRACAHAKTTERFDRERAKARVKKALCSTKSERILLASKWLFDSRGGIDQLFSFLQCTICLEILLGEQKYADNLSVGDILSNRCAYMVGRNDEDRENILKEFREIYAVRSEIVHRGKSRLSQQNINQLAKLRNYCGRVIVKEIDLLAVTAQS